jgi:hypothetical protein
MKKPTKPTTSTTPSPARILRPLREDHLRDVQGGQRVTLGGVADDSV